MAKKPADPETSISLDNVLPAVDRKDVNWWETLKPGQQAKFPGWLYMRYSATVQGPADLSRYYLMAVNERVNKHFSVLNKNHKKLQYLLMTSASPGMGKQYHPYMQPPRAGKGSVKRRNLIASLFPMSSEKEIDVIAATNTDDDIRDHLIDLGWSDKDIKKAFAKQETETEE